MPFFNGLYRCALALIVTSGLCGCLSSGDSQDEEKERHFVEGKRRLTAMDEPGALECFEKALEVNPRSAAAHFEAGLLYEKNKPDHASAIYHFERYLQLRPGSGYATVVNQHILACKQELAKTVSLGPVTQSLQRELEDLRHRNKILQAEVDAWRAKAHQLTNNAPLQTTTSARVLPNPSVASAVSSATPQPGQLTVSRTSAAGLPARTYTVKSGDTLSAIARKYGLRVDTILGVNPKVDARRLRVGQLISIPLQQPTRT